MCSQFWRDGSFKKRGKNIPFVPIKMEQGKKINDQTKSHSSHKKIIPYVQCRRCLNFWAWLLYCFLHTKTFLCAHFLFLLSPSFLYKYNLFSVSLRTPGKKWYRSNLSVVLFFVCDHHIIFICLTISRNPYVMMLWREKICFKKRRTLSRKKKVMFQTPTLDGKTCVFLPTGIPRDGSQSKKCQSRNLFKVKTWHKKRTITYFWHPGKHLNLFS